MVSIFRSSITERIALKAPLYSLHVVAVNPRVTSRSEEHEHSMREYRLDRHMASTYLIALKARRALKNLQRP